MMQLQNITIMMVQCIAATSQVLAACQYLSGDMLNQRMLGPLSQTPSAGAQAL